MSEPFPLLSKSARFLGATSGIDKVYRTLVYTSRIIAWTLVQKYGAESDLAKRFTNLASPLAETRVVLRLFGILSTLEGVLVVDEKDPFLRPIRIIQAWSMMVYYPFENIYWLGWKQVIPMSDEMQNHFSVWSCRAWLLYIILDILADGKGVAALLDQEKKLKGKENTKELQEQLKVLQNQKLNFLLKFIMNICDVPLALHWSLYNSPFPPISIAASGTISSLASFYMRWKHAK